jgi:hypothetical protein
MISLKAPSIAAVAVAILVAGAGQAHAGVFPVFYSWGGEKIIKVADFPDTEEWKTREDKYLDAGYRYKQITIFFVPIWNYDEQWCGYIGHTDYYLNLNKTQLDSYAAAAGVKLPDEPGLSFWELYGGKLLVAALVLLGKLGKSKASG